MDASLSESEFEIGEVDQQRSTGGLIEREVENQLMQVPHDILQCQSLQDLQLSDIY